jgi:hypothetical protein
LTLKPNFSDGLSATGIDGVRVSKDGLTVVAPESLCRRPEHDHPPSLEPGGAVALFHPAALPAISPGFFMAVSDAPFPPAAVLRFYWNIVPRGASVLMRAVTGRLNAAGVPFRFKVLDTPDAYERADSAVLYLPREAANYAAASLTAIYRDAAAFLDPAVPSLTLSLVPGLGVAEDPPGGESFGVSRCRLIAQGLNDAFEAGDESAQGKMDAVRRRFSTSGLSTAAPYLSAESGGEWVDALQKLAWGRPRPSLLRHSNPFQLSESIGNEILSRAIWHEGRCTWISAVNEPLSNLKQRRFGTLDGSLYTGTAGLALLFAELARATGSPRYREAALGCLRYAVKRSLVDEAMPAFSAYTGVSGVAWVAALLTHLLANDEAGDHAAKLLAHLATRHDSAPEVDFLTGAAGCILALLSVGRMGFSDRTPALVDCGERLLAAARHDGSNWTWSTPDAPKRPPLTGLSHGAAGIAAALAALHRKTGDVRFREASYGALSYERSCFDSIQSNWPDFRDVSKNRTARRNLPYTCYWCHGAPGIALGRAATAQALEDATLLAEARIAWDTTAQWVSATAESPSESHCLCHGLPGNTLVLGSGLSKFPAPPPAWRRAHDDALQSLVTAYSAPSTELRRNLYDSGSTGLMLGAGGIAYFFLSACRAETTSVLILQETFQDLEAVPITAQELS